MLLFLDVFLAVQDIDASWQLAQLVARHALTKKVVDDVVALWHNDILYCRTQIAIHNGECDSRVLAIVDSIDDSLFARLGWSVVGKELAHLFHTTYGEVAYLSQFAIARYAVAACTELVHDACFGACDGHADGLRLVGVEYTMHTHSSFLEVLVVLVVGDHNGGVFGDIGNHLIVADPLLDADVQ